MLQCVAEIPKTPTLPPQRSHLSVACLRLTFFVAVCCSLLHCVAEIPKTPTLPPQRRHLSVACLRLTFFVAVCCSLLHCVAKILKTPILPPQRSHLSVACLRLTSLSHFVALCCKISQNANTTSSTTQRLCRTSQVYIVCCSVLQCVAEFLKMPSLPPQRSYGVLHVSG